MEKLQGSFPEVQLKNYVSKRKPDWSGKIMGQNKRALLIIHFIVLYFVFKIAKPYFLFDGVKQTDFFYP